VDAVGVVGVSGAALGFAPGVFGGVDVAEVRVFGGEVGGGLGLRDCGGEEEDGCQRGSCDCHGVDLRTCFGAVLPDGPTARGAATPLRTEAFGLALPLVANRMLLPTNGRAARSLKKACERPPHA